MLDLLDPNDCLYHLKELAEQFHVPDVAKEILDNPDFLIWSGAGKPNQHHYGKHGLIIHTTEVVDLCLMNNSFFQRDKSKFVDDEKLFLAALYHDSGKIFDYAPIDTLGKDVPYKDWDGTLHKREIHHISESHVIWRLVAAKTNYKDEKLEVSHAILAHHGLREWGSPVSPHSRIAWMLHLCDGISARMDDCDRWDMVK